MKYKFLQEFNVEGWCSHTLIRVVWLCLSVTFYLNQDYPTSSLFWATVDEELPWATHLMQWCPAQSLRGHILLCVILVLAISLLCDKHQDWKQLAERGGGCNLPYTSTSQSIYAGSQIRDSDRNLQAGTKAKTIKKSCLLACSPWLAQFPLQYNLETQDHRLANRPNLIKASSQLRLSLSWWL